MTWLGYLHEPQSMTCGATLLSIDAVDVDSAIIVDRTPFYPRGGGQLSDIGRICGENGEMQVRSAILRDDGWVLHVGTTQGRFDVGECVTLEVDQQNRRTNSRLHTAGEALCAAVARLGKNWPVTSACHMPGQSRVAFDSDLKPEQLSGFIDKLHEELESIIAADFSVKTFLDVDVEVAARLCPLDTASFEKKGGIRLVSPAPGFHRPCLGAHLSRTSEIGAVRFRKARLKKQELSVSYELV